MATLTPIRTSRRPGINYNTQGTAASAGGDNWKNTGQETLVVINGGGSTIVLTQTLGIGGVVDGLAPTDPTVMIPAGNTMTFGPFPVATYNDSLGYMNVHYSSVANVTVLVQQPGS